MKLIVVVFSSLLLNGCLLISGSEDPRVDGLNERVKDLEWLYCKDHPQSKDHVCAKFVK